MISRLREWLRHGLWQEDLRRATRRRALGIGAARVSVYAFQSFRQNLVGIQAAGLTTITLLALVPLLWLGFGVIKGLGFAEAFEKKLDDMSKSSDLPANLKELIWQFQSMVDGITYQTLELPGVVILAYTAYALFTKVEKAFNHVWKARRRSWYGRIGGFVTVVVLVPILVLVGMVGESVLQEGVRQNLPRFVALYDTGMQFVPLLVTCIALTVLYKLMPSAKVRWSAATVSGIIAAVVLILVHRFYIGAQVGLALFNQVYAALAALPMLIIYLTIAWTVILAGVQVSFAVQNVNSIGPPPQKRSD